MKQTPSLPDADPRSDRPRSAGRKSKFLAVIGATCLVFGPVNTAKASVVAVATGYEVSYGITLHTLPTNGGDILDTFIFEWNESGEFNVDYGYAIAGRSTTNIIHIIGFEPTAALLMGYALGTPGVGDEKDHLFTLVNSSFANGVIGRKWSEVFPGLTPATRIGHDAMVRLLIDAAGDDLIALDKLTNFVKNEASQAAFDPSGGFAALEWTIGNPDIPEPGTYALLAVGCAGVLALRRRK